MSVQVQMQMYMQVQYLVCTVQCVGCSVLPIKDEDLAVEMINRQIKILYLKITFQKEITLKYLTDPA